jgi:hypothetical protein
VQALMDAAYARFKLHDEGENASHYPDLAASAGDYHRCPAKGGIRTFAPPLDATGNEVRCSPRRASCPSNWVNVIAWKPVDARRPT